MARFVSQIGKQVSLMDDMLDSEKNKYMLKFLMS